MHTGINAIIIHIVITLQLWLGNNAYETYFSEIEKCKITTRGKEYIGNVRETGSGSKCLEWTKDILEEMKLTQLDLSDLNTSLAKNFCRNPSGFPNGPWCVIETNPIKWEYCRIQSCNKGRNWCKDTTLGGDYIGRLNLTITGSACQPWINQNKYSANLFPSNSLKDAVNFCRNPGNSKQSPWCFTKDINGWGNCNVPQCDKSFSQIEYFGGYDFLKTIVDNVKIIIMDNIYRKMNFSVSFKSDLWNSNIQRKTSLWATEYNPECQTDLNEYEYCKVVKISQSNSQTILHYQCQNLFKYLIFISPLDKSQYVTDYQLGEIYEPNKKLSSQFSQYKIKIENFIKQRDKNTISLITSENQGFFYLINDNVIPYAVTPDNKVVMSISEVGKGRIGFFACEHYTRARFKDSLTDFYQFVYGKEEMFPHSLNLNSLRKLDDLRKAGKHFVKPLIWNAHKTIGVEAVNLLLDLVTNGLRVIIGIKPWAYNSYRQSIENSELKPILLAAGIWPSTDIKNKNITVIDIADIQTFPLVHLLGYAKSNIKNAMKVSEVISDTLFYIPSVELSGFPNFNVIFENIESLLSQYIPYSKSLVPCLVNPLTKGEDKKLIGFINSLLIHSKKKWVAPGVSFYPGRIFSENLELVQVRMKLNLRFEDEAAQLGLYVNPGMNASISMETTKSEICTLYINFHLSDIYSKDKWYKWPVTKAIINIKNGEQKSFSSAFGGLLSISCQKNDEKVNITLNGVVRVPMFDRRDPKLTEKWKEFEQKDAPWAVIASDTIVFVVPSNTIRNLAEPGPILELYDEMIKEAYHFKGKSVSNNRRELLVADIQIKLGYMHSGYPIGTQMFYLTNPTDTSKFIFDKTNIKKEGRWGIIHEIGHNLQEDIFTFSGTEDVTNNIFTLMAIEAITGESSWSLTEGWLAKRSYFEIIFPYIIIGSFDEWKDDPFIGLGVYAQIREHFGWELYFGVFRKYKQLAKTVEEISDDEKIQLWIKETSIQAKMNLCPLYSLWRWPVDKDTDEQLKYPYFMPDDFLTKEAEERVNEIINEYGGPSKVLRKPIKVHISMGPFKNKLLIEGSKLIEEMTIIV